MAIPMYCTGCERVFEAKHPMTDSTEEKARLVTLKSEVACPWCGEYSQVPDGEYLMEHGQIAFMKINNPTPDEVTTITRIAKESAEQKWSGEQLRHAIEQDLNGKWLVDREQLRKPVRSPVDVKVRSEGPSERRKPASPEAKRILENARGTLRTAELGLALLLGENDAETQMAGLRNVATFGRAVTFALQNLRKKVDGFEEWYAPKVEEMKNDEVMRFFVGLRNDVEKKGELGTHSGLHMNGVINIHDLMSRFPPPTPDASFFIGDRIGGSGYIVRMPDGTEEKYYVAMPSQLLGLSLDMTVRFNDAPVGHEHRPVGEMCQEYLTKIRAILTEATSKFGR